MGTRADFYIGRGKDAVYLGSTAWEGYPDGIVKTISKGRYECKTEEFPQGQHLFDSKTEEEFKERLDQYFEKRTDVSLPHRDGWPWPWDTSHTTDYSYAFDDGQVFCCSFGHCWFTPAEYFKYIKEVNRRQELSEDELEGLPELEDPSESKSTNGKECIFPNMKDIQNVTFGSRSGVMVFTSKGEVK